MSVRRTALIVLVAAGLISDTPSTARQQNHRAQQTF